MTTATLQDIDVAEPRQKRERYPRYTPTGVPWLAEMPAHWKNKRLRFVVTFPSKAEVRNLPPETPVSFVPMEAVGEFGGLRLDQTRPLEDVVNGYTYFHDGDVLVAKITPCFENGKGAIAERLENRIGFGTTELHVLRAGNEILPRFLFYLTLGEHFRKLGTGEMYGAGGQKRVPERFLQNLRHPLPPLEEQGAIGAFLDRETVRIDELIGKKAAIIELLQQQYTTRLFLAVTKGLSKSNKLTDSGIEWIGKIPTHWKLKKVRHLTRILRGKFTHRPRNDPRMYDGPYPFIQTGDVSGSEKYIREYSQTLSEAGFAVSKQFPKGTLVMTIAANIGDMAILDFEACFPDSIVGFVPGHDISIDYLFYLFKGMRQALFSTATLNTQLNLNIERIGSLWTVAPPLNEQAEIVRWLEEKQAKTLNTTKIIANAIIRLRDYRAALISTAVTGQIDVRNYIPEAPCQ